MGGNGIGKKLWPLSSSLEMRTEVGRRLNHRVRVSVIMEKPTARRVKGVEKGRNELSPGIVQQELHNTRWQAEEDQGRPYMTLVVGVEATRRAQWHASSLST